MDKKDKEFFEALAREYSSFTGEKITAAEIRDHFEVQVQEMDGSLVDMLSAVESARKSDAVAPFSYGNTAAEKRADWASKMSLFTYGQDLVDWGVSRGKFRDATQPLIDATKKSIQQSLDSIGALSALPLGFQEAVSTSNTSIGRVPIPETSPRGRSGAIGSLPTENWGNSSRLGYQKIDPAVSRVFVGNIATKGTTPNEGIDRMNQRAQQGLLDFVRASGRHSPTITATVGSHKAGNKTHTPGAAFDSRTRDLSPAATRAQLEAAMYSRPDRIGYNDSAFSPHLHVDYNGAYGRGVASRSRTGGLPTDLQTQLQAFDAYHKGTNPEWVPAVPTAIAPTPERAPRGPLGPSLSAITGAGLGRVSDEMSQPTMPSNATRMAPGPTADGLAARWNGTTGLLTRADQRIAELNRAAIANTDRARFANFSDIPSARAPNAYGAPTAIGQGAMTNAGADNRGTIGPGNQAMVNLERSLMSRVPADRFKEAARPSAITGNGISLSSVANFAPGPTSTGDASRWNVTTGLLTGADRRIAELNRPAVSMDSVARQAQNATRQSMQTETWKDVAAKPQERLQEAARPMAPTGTPGNMGAAGYGVPMPARQAPVMQSRVVTDPRVGLPAQRNTFNNQLVPAAPAVAPARAPAPMPYSAPQAKSLANAYAGYAAARGAPLAAQQTAAPAPVPQRVAPAPVVAQPRPQQQQITNEPQYSGRTPGDRARSAAFQPGGIFGYTSQMARGGGGYNPTPV